MRGLDRLPKASVWLAVKLAEMTDAQLALAAGEANDTIGFMLAAAESEREWLLSILREIAERAGVAPKALDEG